jgi:hypothetical protein
MDGHEAFIGRHECYIGTLFGIRNFCLYVRVFFLESNTLCEVLE